MSDAQYDFIKENLPEWASEVEDVALVYVSSDGGTREYYEGILRGLARGAERLGVLTEAAAFVHEAVDRAKEAREK